MMKKENSTLLGYGLMVLALFVYGLHTKKRWLYYLLTMIFIAPVGGTIGFALGKDSKSSRSTSTSNFTKPVLPPNKVVGYQFDKS